MNKIQANKKSNAQRIAASQQLGFTLLELLVVVTILSIIAGLAVVSYGDIDDQSKNSTALSEMKEIQKALIQFKRDTGYFPGQGPFRLAIMVPNSYRDPYIIITALPPNVTTNQAAWFISPANFWSLFGTGNISPLNGTSHPLEFYSADTARGWNGPYLNSIGKEEANSVDEDGNILAGVTVNDGLLINGSGGDILTGNALPPMPVVLDPWGNPYLFYLEDHTGFSSRIISTGPDGVYASSLEGLGDDIVLEIPR